MDSASGLVSKADQKLKGGLFSCFGGSRRYEDASELYSQAATQFKLSKEWQEAADCYSQCAFCSEKSGGSAGEQAAFLTEAGHCLKRISTRLAVERYEQAVGLHQAGGHFGQAGKLLMATAELGEAETLSAEETKEVYKRAAEMFEMDDHSKSNYSKCMLKVAELMARAGEYRDATEIFEKEGEKSLQNTMTQYGAKDHFMRAGLLHLAVGDSVTINLALDRYRGLDPRFASSREGELLAGLSEAFEAHDVDAFVDHLHKYDSVTKLDAFCTAILVKVKDANFPTDTSSAVDTVDLT